MVGHMETPELIGYIIANVFFLLFFGWLLALLLGTIGLPVAVWQCFVGLWLLKVVLNWAKN